LNFEIQQVNFFFLFLFFFLGFLSLSPLFLFSIPLNLKPRCFSLFHKLTSLPLDLKSSHNLKEKQKDLKNFSSLFLLAGRRPPIQLKVEVDVFIFMPPPPPQKKNLISLVVISLIFKNLNITI